MSYTKDLTLGGVVITPSVASLKVPGEDWRALPVHNIFTGWI